MILSTETLRANLTWIRTFICVSSFVNQKIVGLSKMAMTELANKLLFRPRWSISRSLSRLHKPRRTYLCISRIVQHGWKGIDGSYHTNCIAIMMQLAYQLRLFFYVWIAWRDWSRCAVRRGWRFLIVFVIRNARRNFGKVEFLFWLKIRKDMLSNFYHTRCGTFNLEALISSNFWRKLFKCCCCRNCWYWRIKRACCCKSGGNMVELGICGVEMLVDVEVFENGIGSRFIAKKCSIRWRWRVANAVEGIKPWKDRTFGIVTVVWTSWDVFVGGQTIFL